MPWRFVKDPADKLDYKIDYSGWLTGDDTISSSEWTVDDGLTKESDSTATTYAVIWVSGGTHGKDYQLTNTITTSEGRQKEKSIWIRVRNQ